VASLVPASLWPALHAQATGESWPPSSEPAAERLIARATREALLPLLFAEPDLPAVVRRALERHRAWERIHARRTEALLAALRRIGEALGDEPFVVLKGADYAHRLYPRPSLRPMQDLDLLVVRERMAEVARRLTAAGLRPTPTGTVTELASHHEKLFRLGDVSVDVHHSFLQRPRNRVDYVALWARRVELAAPGVAAWRLADVDALLYHAVSMAADEFYVPLLRYVDLWRMLAVSPGLADEAVARAREWGVARALYGTLRLLAWLCPEAAALGAETAAARLLGQPARRFLDRRVLPEVREYGDGPRPGRAVQLWRKFWLIDGLGRRVAFALYHGRAVWQARRVLGPAALEVSGPGPPRGAGAR